MQRRLIFITHTPLNWGCGQCLIVLLLTILVFQTGCQAPGTKRVTNYASCLSCHRGIESISRHHDFECAGCHLRPEDRGKEILGTHEVLIRNPSDPAHVNTFCLPCHEQDIFDVQNSLHASMAGIINQTRYLWGAQEQAVPAIYGLSGRFQPLPVPDPSVYPDTPQLLVDDFLRRRCLRCHIHAPGPEGEGLYRATGCAACHMVYKNDGRYRGKDAAIDPSLQGYPAKHMFTVDLPNTQCLHCHNQNHVGADYEGLFEHDYSSTYRSPMKEGNPAPMTYGLDYHHLSKDIHREKGLWCIDCHRKAEIMGDGNAYSYEMEVPKRTCEGCHGGFEGPFSPDPSDPAIREVSGEFFFVSSHHRNSYALKMFSARSAGHRNSAHARLRCSACHAQWSYQDYGLSVIREDRAQGFKWYHLVTQGDPSVERVLRAHLDNPDKMYPVSRDWISGEERPGVWCAGWRFRRWEYMPLGLDHQGRYTIMRPLYQYLISYVDRLGNTPLDSTVPLRGDKSGKGWAFMPYVPHTISPIGRRCEGCHANRTAVGLGIESELTSDTRLTVPSPPPIHSMHILGPTERKNLLKPSKEWNVERLRTHEELLDKYTSSGPSLFER